MAVVHFPCTTPEHLGPSHVDPNAAHESEEAVARKYVVQQFVWAARPMVDDVDEAVRLYWRSFEDDQPNAPLTSEVV